MARQSGRFIAGLLTGALVGASLAMVLAPAPTDDMRERLRALAAAPPDRP
jgi:gas vesicle protein